MTIKIKLHFNQSMTRLFKNSQWDIFAAEADKATAWLDSISKEVDENDARQ